MLKTFIVLFCLSALTLAGQSQEAVPMTDAQRQEVAKEIRMRVDEWRQLGKDMNENSFNKAMEFYLETSDESWMGKPALFVNRLQIIPTKEAFDKLWRPIMGKRQSEVQESIDDYIAVLSPYHAVYFYKGKDVIASAGGKTENLIAATVVFVKKSGLWKILHYHQSWEPVPKEK